MSPWSELSSTQGREGLHVPQPLEDTANVMEVFVGKQNEMCNPLASKGRSPGSVCLVPKDKSLHRTCLLGSLLESGHTL